MLPAHPGAPKKREFSIGEARERRPFYVSDRDRLLRTQTVFHRPPMSGLWKTVFLLAQPGRSRALLVGYADNGGLTFNPLGSFPSFPLVLEWKGPGVLEQRLIIQ